MTSSPQAAVRSRHGLVARQNRHAAAAGRRRAGRGGNAMDAAIVTALVLSVVEPWLSASAAAASCCMPMVGPPGQVDALDFNVRSPGALDPADYPLPASDAANWFNWPPVQDDATSPATGSICTPGAAGFAAALERSGGWSWWTRCSRGTHRACERAGGSTGSLPVRRSRSRRWPSTRPAPSFPGRRRAPRASPMAPDRARRPMPAKGRTLRRRPSRARATSTKARWRRTLVRDLQAGGSVISAADPPPT